GDCSMAMTRDCFEPGSAFLPLGSMGPCCGALAAPPAADGVAERFRTDFDIKILRSVKAASTPHHRSPISAMTGGAGSRKRPQRPALTTLPLQSRPNASPFWIMLLLSVGALEYGMIKQIAAPL